MIEIQDSHIFSEQNKIQDRRLLLGTSSNLHQITLAESIVFLFQQSWVEKQEKIKLIDVLEYFAKS